MALEALDHYTIQCADMTATRDFYRDVLGLADGFRPDLGFPGFWLYAGDKAVVHLLGTANALPENRNTKPGSDTNGLDHIAFRGSEAAATSTKLKQHGVA